MKSLLLHFVIFNCIVILSSDLQADTVEQKSDKILFFENHVRPILVKHCYSCHGIKKQHAELRLDSRKRMLKGGESGPAIIPMHPEESLLIESVKRESFEMPPEEELPEKEIEILTKWIKEGAYWPENPLDEEENNEEKFRKHWAFLPISKPKIPAVKNKNWPQNAIDHFVLSQLEEKQLSPSPQADRNTIIKRMKWDLIGLPVSDKEADLFRNNQNENATPELINQYLASDHYGERWGRYWLDLARYADTKGYVFFEKPTFHNGFTYRDYVIRSFNEDKPYNQFLLEQIAADQLEGIPHDSLAGLGFITIGARFKNDIDDIMSDRIDVVSRGLLGLTVGCARCHDHKYDPVTMEDYYSFYGIFRNSVQPLHLPFRSGDQISDDLKDEAKKIKTAAVDLNKFLRDKYVVIMKEGEKQLGEYLKVAQSKRSGPNTVMFDVIVDGDDLIPELLLIWQRYLSDTENNHSPLFVPWHALANLPKEGFPENAKKILNELQSKQSTEVNRILLNKLSSAKLKSFEDVIPIYVKEIQQAQEEWKKAKEKQSSKKTVTLDNPDKEELRLVISGINSPLQVPFHYFRVLGLFPDRKSQEKVKKLNDSLDKIRTGVPTGLAQMLVLEDVNNIIEPRVFKRGNAARLAQKATRRYLRFFTEVNDKPFTKGSGRLELARAIVSPRNPLTARVIVNRVWQKHFGQGLVKTVSDFGLQSEKPSHQMLLDYLASWFMEHHWSIKELHRHIMQSATYQQQSFSRPEGEKIDPENNLYWRMNRRRQDFETMRDSLLAVSDQLDLTIGGQSVKGIMKKNNKRRTIYTHIDRQNLPSVYRTFDFPPPDVSSGDRSSTIVPGQTLFLMNHPLVISSAKSLSEGAESQEDPRKGIEWLYRKILARSPTQQESDEMISFLQTDETEEKEIFVNNQWKYGYGAYDLASEKLLNFKEISYWTGNQLQGGESLPDSKVGWIFLSATGGHPGNDMEHVAVMRWTAPESMTVSIKGILEHQMPKGNGIRARVLAGGNIVLGPWSIHKKSVEANLEKFKIQKGETIDFVVDVNDQLGYDSFIWSPVVEIASLDLPKAVKGKKEGSINKAWNYGKEFRSKNKTRVTAWMNLAQVLLISNEFQFID